MMNLLMAVLTLLSAALTYAVVTRRRGPDAPLTGRLTIAGLVDTVAGFVCVFVSLWTRLAPLATYGGSLVLAGLLLLWSGRITNPLRRPWLSMLATLWVMIALTADWMAGYPAAQRRAMLAGVQVNPAWVLAYGAAPGLLPFLVIGATHLWWVYNRGRDNVIRALRRAENAGEPLPRIHGWSRVVNAHEARHGRPPARITLASVLRRGRGRKIAAVPGVARSRRRPTNGVVRVPAAPTRSHREAL